MTVANGGQEGWVHPKTREYPGWHAKHAKGFPWRVIGWRIVLRMWKPKDQQDEERTKGGIIIPTMGGDRGSDKELTMGMVVAHGPGEFVPDIGPISVEHDYDITVGDMVFIEPNAGVDARDQARWYKVVTPNDIIMVNRRDQYLDYRNRWMKEIAEDYSETSRPHGEAFRPGLQEGGPTLDDEKDILERVREAKGEATKTQVVVPAKPKEE